MQTTKLLILLLFCLILPQAAQAKTIYVDNQLPDDCQGNYSIVNRNGFGSDGEAYNTIQKAATAAVAGDNVCLREGIYYQTSRIYIQNKIDTSESKKITFSNYNSEEAIIDGSGAGGSDWQNGVNIQNSKYIVLEGLNFQNYHESVLAYSSSDFGEIRNLLIENVGRRGITLSNSSHTIIDNVTIRNGSIEASRPGIYILTSDYVNITNCHLDGGQGPGISLSGCSYCLVDKNEVSNASGGILVAYDPNSQTISTYNLISNNLIHDNIVDPEGADGISVGAGSRNNIVTHNVVYNNADDGIDSSTMQGASAGITSNLYETITDNIVFNSGYGEAGDGNGIKVSTNCGGGHVVGNNVVFNNKRAGFDQDKALGYPQNFFYNNIAYKNGVDSSSNMYSGFVMDAPSLPQEEDAVLYNNIATNNAKWDLHRSNELAVNDSDYNLWGDGRFVSGMDEHSLSGDPMFNNPDLAVDTNFGIGWSIDQKLEYIRNQVKEKFSLKPESPAIDKGTAIPGYHCSTAGAHPGENCKEWYGAAPDIGAYEYNPNSGTVPYGDISEDGKVSAYDAALTAQASVGLITLTTDQAKAADVSGDGKVSAYDAALIAQYAVGLITRFPVEQ